ncbi:MAG TPA: serine/threonine-protein kinase [Polyangia bacterium]|nr:serine/threonine-protein kinase [Polyangia bacterium]
MANPGTAGGDPLIGTKVGNYKLVRQLGAGGMGVVYAAEHELMGKKAAVKLLLPELSANQEIVGRFFNEAKAATRIQHPGIVDVYDFGYHASGHAYIVMEFLQGEALTSLLKKGLPFARVIDIGWQLSSALGAAHKRGIVHRDVKPDNIFVVPDPATPTGDRVKVLDFGIAKLSSDDNTSMKTRTGTVMGTPVYMSPEQCRGSGEIDHRSDIYAMGCIMYEMACGQPPFVRNGFGELITAHIIEEPDALSTKNPSVPPAYEAIVMKCLEKDPAARFQHTSEIEAALSSVNPDSANVTRIPGLGRAGVSTGRSNRSNRSLPNNTSRAAEAYQVTKTTVAGEVDELAAPAGGSKKKIGIAVGAVVVVAGVAIALLGGGKKEAPAAPAAAAPAPAKAPELETVKLEVTSTPSGASVVRAEDGAFLGRTPFHVSMAKSAKDASFVIRHEGYEDQRVALPLVEDGKSDVTLTAVAKPAAAPEPAAAEKASTKSKSETKAKSGGGGKKKRGWGDLVDF